MTGARGLLATVIAPPVSRRPRRRHAGNSVSYLLHMERFGKPRKTHCLARTARLCGRRRVTRPRKLNERMCPIVTLGDGYPPQEPVHRRADHRALREVDAGAKPADVCRRLGVSEKKSYRWRQRFGGMEVSEAKRLRALEDENNRLKKSWRRR